MSNPRKVAVVHDWLLGMRGGERVLEEICDMFPGAPIYTLFCEEDKLSARLRQHPIIASPANRFSFIRKRYRHFLALFPFLIRGFDLSEFDLIVSSSHCVAKGVRKSPKAVHVSYVHAPMRYMWSRFDDYFGPDKTNIFVRSVARLLQPFFQRWDRRSAQNDRVDILVANSQFISKQIEDFYGRASEVVYPFVDFERFSQGVRSPRTKADAFYLCVSAFAPNKRLDLALDACDRLGRRLKIVGTGQNESAWKKHYGPHIEFLGGLADDEITKLYLECEAFLFPGVEDFGITPLEAMAAGAPIIAYGAGGALETVTSDTGVFFSKQQVDGEGGLVEAILRFESERDRFSSERCRARAAQFSKLRFRNEFSRIVMKGIGRVEASL